MKITGKHPTKLNDPIIQHPAMHGKRWSIDYGYGPHTSFKKLSKSQVDEFAVNNMDTYTDTKHNDVDIGYNEFYEDLKQSNKLTGGVGDATASHNVDPAELSMGQTVEMEHTTDPDIATEIALDHLSEDPQYYTKLRKAGLAKELDIVNASSGFGDPDHPINDKKRLGSDMTCTAGNNIIGKIGNTPDGHIEGFSDKTSIIKKQPESDYTVDLDIKEPSLDEDRCTDIAKRKYKKWPSAYASGAVVRCRKGKIWKNTNEELDIEENELEERFDKEKSQGLRGWFARRGGKGGKGWVDCNTCRKDKKTGRKTCKSCGRKAGEKRSKYPACRPTPAQCNKTGTRRKKGPSTISWNEQINEASNSGAIITGQNPTGKVNPIRQPTTTSTSQAQVTNPKINNGYKASRGSIEGSGEETSHDRPYDFFQYKRDNAKFGNGNIIKKNGRVSLYELAKNIIKENIFAGPLISELPNKIKSHGTEWEIGNNRVVGKYVYYGFDAAYADKIHKLCVHYIYNQNPQLKELIRDVYFYLLGKNPILKNINIDINNYNDKKTPELDIIYGVVSGISPQDIEHFVVDTKGFGGSKNKEQVGYIQKPKDL